MLVGWGFGCYPSDICILRRGTLQCVLLTRVDLQSCLKQLKKSTDCIRRQFTEHLAIKQVRDSDPLGEGNRWGKSYDWPSSLPGKNLKDTVPARGTHVEPGSLVWRRQREKSGEAKSGRARRTEYEVGESTAQTETALENCWRSSLILELSINQCRERTMCKEQKENLKYPGRANGHSSFCHQPK